MKITRRNFVQVIGTAAAVTVSGGGLTAAFGQLNGTRTSFPMDAATDLFSMKAAHVQELVGRSFLAASAEGKAVELVLTEVNPIDRKANAARGFSGECFSAIFKSPHNEQLTQDVYEMQATSLDPFSALLVPTGRYREDYELIVNHVRG